MKKIISFIMVLAMVLSVSSVAFAVDVNISESTIKDTIASLRGTTDTNITFKMEDGNYAFTDGGNYLHYGWGTETNHINEVWDAVNSIATTSEQKNYTLTVDSLEFTGSEKAVITAMQFKGGAGNFFYPYNKRGGIIYDQSFDIGTLKFSGITFDSELHIDASDKCEIDNLVFENVTFSKGDDAPSDGSAVYILANNKIGSITFKNCTFKDCDTVENGCIVTNCTSADDVDITIDGCIFESSGYNAIQIAGAGPYTGDISITNNKINNTKDRGIRISNTTDKANISIEGNTLVSATDDDNEAIKIDGGAAVIVKNNTLDGNPIPQSAVNAKDASSLSVTYDTPTTSPKPASTGSGISVKYNGGNSFSTSKSDVPTGVEIDGVAVPFSGTGSNFTVGCVDPGAKWVTVRWNSTSVTTNFTPDGLVECSVSIPKTGDMPFWAAVLALFGF